MRIRGSKEEKGSNEIGCVCPFPASCKGITAMVRNGALLKTKVQGPSRRKDLFLGFLEVSIFGGKMMQSIQAIFIYYHNLGS